MKGIANRAARAFARLRKDEDGMAAIEYAPAAGVAAAVVVVLPIPGEDVGVLSEAASGAP